MQSFTFDQAILLFEKDELHRLKWAEIQSGIVCSMLAGKYKPRRAPAKELNIDDLESMGMIKDMV